MSGWVNGILKSNAADRPDDVLIGAPISSRTEQRNHRVMCCWVQTTQVSPVSDDSVGPSWRYRGNKTLTSKAWLFVLATAAVLTTPSVAEPAEQRVFTDWTVSCDAAAFCRAMTGREMQLVVQRYQHSDQWEILLESGYTSDPYHTTVSVQLDGRTLDFSGYDEINSYGRRGDFYFMSDKAQDLLSAMVQGAYIRMSSFEGNGGPGSVDFSLAGLSATLLWIDERQDRVGDSHIAGSPPYGLLPVGQHVDDSITVPHGLVQHHRADESCSPFEALASGRDSIVASLGNEQSIAVLPCWDGAYDFGSSVYLFGDQDYRQIFFAEYSDADAWYVSKHLVNVNLDLETGTLSSFSRGRGLGDCGSAGTWQWTRSEFRLETYRYKEDCDGMVDPGQLPVIFTATPAR